jgi:hypothetical protein
MGRVYMTCLHAKIVPVATVLVVTLLSGCAGRYIPPDSGSPQATLHIVTNHQLFTISGWSYYTDSRCSDKSSVVIDGFSKLYDGEKRVQIPAGERRFLVVHTTTNGLASPYSCGTPTCMSWARCVIEFEMIPVTGRTYRATHSGDGQSCSVEITNEATGLPVIDEARQIAAEPTCTW